MFAGTKIKPHLKHSRALFKIKSAVPEVKMPEVGTWPEVDFRCLSSF